MRGWRRRVGAVVPLAIPLLFLLRPLPAPGQIPLTPPVNTSPLAPIGPPSANPPPAAAPEAPAAPQTVPQTGPLAIPQAVPPAVPPAAAPAPAPGSPEAAQPAAPEPVEKSVWLPRHTAELQILDKVDATHEVRDVAVGSSLKVAGITIAVEACLVRPANEQRDAAAYVDITDANPAIEPWKGWLLAAEPGASVFEHPIYDVRVTGCL